MIGLPSTSGGANISTGQGQGAAQVLDTSSFDPIEFIKGINQYREQQALAERKKQLERQAKWNKVGMPDVTYVTDYNKQELEDAVNKYSQFVTEGYKRGIDPDYDAGFKRDLEKVQMGILATEEASKKIDAVVTKYAAEKDKYEPEQWAEWMEGLAQQPTVQDRLKYVQSKQPYTEKINPVMLLGDIIKPENLLSITQKRLGNGVIATTEEVKPEDIKQLLQVSLYGNSAYDDRLTTYMEQQGLKTADELEANLFAVAETLVPKKKETQTVGHAPRSGGGFGSNTTPVTTINPAGIQADLNFLPDKDVVDPLTKTTTKGLNTLKKSNSPADWDLLAATDLSDANADVNGIFVVNVKDNMQTREGNFIGNDGKPVTGRVNGFKFSQDGSLWVYVSDKLLPLVPSREVASKELKDKGLANAKQVAYSLGRDWAELKNEIYNMKEGKSDSSATPANNKGGLTKGGLDGL